MKLNIIKRSAPESGSAASRESHHQTFGMMVILDRAGKSELHPQDQRPLLGLQGERPAEPDGHVRDDADS